MADTETETQPDGTEPDGTEPVTGPAETVPETTAPSEGDPTSEPSPSEPDPEPDEDADEDVDGQPVEPGDEQMRQQQNAAKAQTAAEVERINKALAREAQRHAGRVVEIMGADSDILEQCPLCLPLIPGFRYPTPPVAEQLAAVKEAIGEPATPNYRPDQYSKVCDVCDGLGGVLTGSKVANQATLPCIKCGAQGWLPIGPERQGAQAAPINGGAPPVSYTLPPVDTPDPPEVASLKALGYIVVPPVEPSPLVTP